MYIDELDNYLMSLFDREKLLKFKDEWGFTYKDSKDVSLIGYATNLTPETVQGAIDKKVDLIITHHDAWDFVYGMKEKCMSMLRQHGISHYFNHLLLDDADFGTNVSLMEKIGARIVEKSNLYQNDLFAGRIGEFETPLTFPELTARVENILGERVKAWQNNSRIIKRLCVVTGGGSMTRDVKDAVDRNCDVYITGEKVLYTVQYAKFTGTNLIVGSHTYTEIFGVESLVNKLKENYDDLEVIRLSEERIE